MHMMLTKERIILKVELSTVLALNQKSRTNFKLLLQILMMLTRERITLRVEFNIVLA